MRLFVKMTLFTLVLVTSGCKAGLTAEVSDNSASKGMVSEPEKSKISDKSPSPEQNQEKEPPGQVNIEPTYIVPSIDTPSVKGGLLTGQTIEAVYTLDEGSDFDTSEVSYRWYRSSDPSGMPRTEILGEISKTYEIQGADSDLFLSFDVVLTPSKDPEKATTLSYFTKQVSTSSPFTSKWLIPAANQIVTLPLVEGYQYNFTVDWGDGSPIEEINGYRSDVSHTYALSGTYDVTINGLMEAISFAGQPSAAFLWQVNDLGSTGLKTLFQAFKGCSALDTFSGGMTRAVTNMSGMFSGAIGITTLDLSSLDTSNVSDMSYMFRDLTNLLNIDVSIFDTSKVTNMSHMFMGMSSVTSLDLSNFDTSNVTNMEDMFHDMPDLISLDVSGFNTSKVENMSAMFRRLSSVSTLDLSHFDTSNVTDMKQMFSLSGFTSLDVSNFDTRKVEDMSHMFELNTNLSTLDLSSFVTSEVTDMGSLFDGMLTLTNLDVSQFDTTKVIDASRMFRNLQNISSLNLSNFDTASMTNMEKMFEHCTSLTALDLSSFDTSKVINMSSMFYNTSSLTLVNATGWDVGAVESSGNIFVATNAGLSITCDLGGSPGTGDLFGEPCL